MLSGHCHCGNVQIRVADPPDTATVCNCSTCRRYAATWLFCHPDQVEIDAREPTSAYRWGDETIDFHHCPRCGCITHYTSTGKSDVQRTAVNLNMMAAEDVNDIRQRRFDGADTWQYLDD